MDLFVRVLVLRGFDLGEGGVGSFLELEPIATVKEAPGAVEEEVKPEETKEGPEDIIVDEPAGNGSVSGSDPWIAILFRRLIVVGHFHHPLAFDI